MKKNIKKLSFAALFTAIALSIVIFVTATLSVVFFVNFRNVSYRQVESVSGETMRRMQQGVIAMLDEHTGLLKHSAQAVTSLLSASSPEAARGPMQDYFREAAKTLPTVSFLYYSNNIKWNLNGGVFVLNIDWTPDADYDQTQRGWFTDAKKAGGEIAYQEPYVDVIENVITVAMSMSIKDSAGRDIGAVSEEITGDALNKLVQSGEEGSQQTFLLSTGGLYITNPDKTAVMNKDRDFFKEHDLSLYRDKMLTYSSFQGETKDNLVYSAIIPGAGWVLVSLLPKASVFAEVNRLLLMSIILSAVLLFAAAVILIIFTRRMVRPLLGITKTLREISSDWDLTKRIDTRRAAKIAEFADIAEVFNLTFENMKELITLIKNQTRDLSDTGSSLSSRMTETTAAINQIADNIQGIKERVLSQSAAVTETNATMDQITGNIGKLDEHISTLTGSVSTSSSAIEQMLANIQSVTQTLVKNSGNVNSLADASDVGHQGLRDVAADIQEIERESEGLLEINAVMQNISSQTNLLSMNAAIEAAHAGESGKGFAVVADEIRKLAENSSEQSKTISAVLKKITSSIDKITTATDNVLNKFEAIGGGVKVVADQEENIRNAMEEQSQGSRQVFDSIGQLNEVTQMVKNGSQEMLQGSRQVITEGKNLESTTIEISNGMNEMAEGADKISKAVDEVNKLSSRNKDNIDILLKEVSRFKVI
ncbi:MAG: methyl-accepting chemotaxis protein [Termitinemataceae bacterium]|nr:MAG: methyl-accepting chemotaxis protein [Termitinemataceae bacterium]